VLLKSFRTPPSTPVGILYSGAQHHLDPGYARKTDLAQMDDGIDLRFNARNVDMRVTKRFEQGSGQAVSNGRS
jgi:hypothetical protein